MSTPTSLITEINYELTNASGDFTSAELLSYINRSLEMIHSELVHNKSESVRTGTGSFDCVVGTQSYDLTDGSGANSSDIWALHRVWIEESEPMDLCTEEDLYDTINAEEASETGHRCEPEEYCLIVDQLWFKESPDDTYTVQIRYFPKFVAIAADGAMPYNDMANLEVKSMAVLMAKNRVWKNDNLHGQLLGLNNQARNRIMNLREKKDVRIRPGRGLMRCH